MYILVFSADKPVQDFHHCGLEPNDNIVNYGNRLEVQTCQLVGLAECVVPYDVHVIDRD